MALGRRPPCEAALSFKDACRKLSPQQLTGSFAPTRGLWE
jgi:hypothetical protein